MLKNMSQESMILSLARIYVQRMITWMVIKKEQFKPQNMSNYVRWF